MTVLVLMLTAFALPGQGRSAAELERVLIHELTHALVHSIAPRGVPQWLNEGLAQIFEPGERGATSALVSQASTLGEARSNERSRMPLSRLEQSFEGLGKEDARIAYAQSTMATQALVDQAGMAGILNLLSFVGEGLPFEVAFARATFMSYADFQKTWNGASRTEPPR